jgi:hypothetical protein
VDLVSGSGAEAERRLFERHGSVRSIHRTDQWEVLATMLQLQGTMSYVDIPSVPVEIRG